MRFAWIDSGGREIAILTSSGSFRMVLANVRILGGMVAENMIVWQ